MAPQVSDFILGSSKHTDSYIAVPDGANTANLRARDLIKMKTPETYETILVRIIVKPL